MNSIDLEDDLEDLRAADRAERASLWAYLAHPDPADPDYPEPEGEDE
jgi:hypothetical protein